MDGLEFVPCDRSGCLEFFLISSVGWVGAACGWGGGSTSVAVVVDLCGGVCGVFAECALYSD